MVVTKIRLYRESGSNLLMQEVIYGQNGLSQNNAYTNEILVVLDGFELASDELLRIAYEKQDGASVKEIVGYEAMTYNSGGAYYSQEVPYVVTNSEPDSTWKISLQIVSGYVEKTDSYKYKESTSNTLDLTVNNAIMDKDGEYPTAHELDAFYLLANGAIQREEKGAPNGVAPLGADGRIDKSYLPEGIGEGSGGVSQDKVEEIVQGVVDKTINPSILAAFDSANSYTSSMLTNYSTTTQMQEYVTEEIEKIARPDIVSILGKDGTLEGIKDPTGNMLYLVPKTDGGGDDLYDEYLYNETTGKFEYLGTRKATVDLTDYVTKDALNDYVTYSELQGNGNDNSGYASKQWVNNKGYVTYSELQGKGYATKTELSKEVETLTDKIEKLNTGGGGESGEGGGFSEETIKGFARDVVAELNIENGSGSGAIQQEADGVPDGFSFVDKNTIASDNFKNYKTNLSDTDRNYINKHIPGDDLETTIPYGAIGNFSFSKGGKSAAFGKRSSAEGTTTLAFGKYSHVEGDNSVTFGDDSHAEGYQTTTAPSANASHAEGYGTVAGGTASHAEGQYTNATGNASHAGGSNSEASGFASRAIGAYNCSSGQYSHAEGYRTQSDGDNSHSEGANTKALGDNSHSEGGDTIAYADYSHAEGNNTHAYGKSSHTEGGGTRTDGEFSHAEGFNTIAGYDHQHVSGRYNDNKANTLFEVGNGVDENNRSNAFEVYQNGIVMVGDKVQQKDDNVAEGFSFKDRNPNAADLDTQVDQWNKGNGNVQYGATGNFSSSFGGKSAAIGKRSHAEGTTTIAKGNYSHVEGDNSVTLGADSHAEGYATVTGPNAQAGHAEGINTQALGLASHAEGHDTIAYGQDSHTEGSNTATVLKDADGNVVAFGEAAHAEGGYTKAVGKYSHSEGHTSQASAEAAHAEGKNTIANNIGAHAEGNSTKASGSYAHAEGNDTNATGYHAHAEGKSTTAKGSNSHAEGDTTTAEGVSSHAGGTGAHAKGNYSFAHGNTVVAGYANQFVVGQFNKNDELNIFEVGNGSDTKTLSNNFEVRKDTPEAYVGGKRVLTEDDYEEWTFVMQDGSKMTKKVCACTHKDRGII